MELQNQFEKFEENKARQKKINVERGRKRQLATMRANPSVEFEGSSSIPSNIVRGPFCYVPPAPKS